VVDSTDPRVACGRLTFRASTPATRYADEIVLMRDGSATGHGSTDEMLAPAIIAATFVVDAVMAPHPSGSRAVIVISG